MNGPAIFHSAEDLTTRFTSNRGGWPQAKLHSQFPGEPGCWENEVTVQFLSAQVEYLPSNKASQELMLAAGRELLALTGPAVLITHSQAGPFGWLLADDKPELVQGIVALEPSGPPFSGDLKNPKAKNYGITDVNMRFDPPVASPEDFELELLKAPGENLSDGWVMKEPCPKLPSLQGIPIALLVSEASYHAGYDHLTSHVLKQLGVDHRFVRLEDVGIHGNGHMMMLEKNNLEIAAWVSQWLQENVNTREKDD